MDPVTICMLRARRVGAVSVGTTLMRLRKRNCNVGDDKLKGLQKGRKQDPLGAYCAVALRKKATENTSKQ